MPGFCSCGFIPRPSSGRNSIRVNGFALNAVVAMKNSRIAASVPVAYGTSSRLRLRLVGIAILAYMDRINRQKSIDPACPLQNAVNTYTLGIVELMWPATYSSEKSRVRSAVHKPADASATIANVAYNPRTPLSINSCRRIDAPANDTVIDQAAINSATHS